MNIQGVFHAVTILETGCPKDEQADEKGRGEGRGNPPTDRHSFSTLHKTFAFYKSSDKPQNRERREREAGLRKARSLSDWSQPQITKSPVITLLRMNPEGYWVRGGGEEGQRWGGSQVFK